MNLLASAIAFAASKHIDQVDKGGKAYILHPLRVMNRLKTDDQELMAIAVLHDVIEDCGVSPDDLRAIGMTERVVSAVMVLTKVKGESYEEFISRVLMNHDAMLVKVEDLFDNLDVSRLECLYQPDIDRIRKYILAIRVINGVLNGR